ncbi:MAG: CARDB domain-containing protein [Candidatus Hydrothermarchaeaceae archaeon]
MRSYVVLLIVTLILLPDLATAFNVDFYITSVSPQVLEPGERANITLTLKNLGTDYAVYVKAVLDPNGTSPLVATGAGKIYLTKKAFEAKSSDEFFGTVSQGDELTANYEVYVSDTAQFGVHSIPLKLIWKDAILEQNEETLSFGIQIAGAADLVISKVSTTPSRIKPGDEFTLTLNVENIGKEDAESVGVTLIDVPQGFTGDTSAFLGTINKGASGSANYNLEAGEEVEPGNYDITMELAYLEKGVGRKALKNFGIFIQEPGEITLAITKVSSDPSKVYPDSDFTLSLGLENVGKQDTKSVEIDLIVPEEFTGETRAFLGPLKEGGSAATDLDLKASKDAKPGAYDALMKINYLDERGVEEMVEKRFQIFVHERGEVKIEIAGITSSPAKIRQGEDFTLSIQLENVGKQDAKTVKAVIQLVEGFTGERTSFLGSLKEDDLSTAIFELGARDDIEPGTHDFSLVVTYTDEVGLEDDEEMTFQMVVTKKDRRTLPYIAGGVVLLLASWFGWRRYGGRRTEGG